MTQKHAVETDRREGAVEVVGEGLRLRDASVDGLREEVELLVQSGVGGPQLGRQVACRRDCFLLERLRRMDGGQRMRSGEGTDAGRQTSNGQTVKGRGGEGRGERWASGGWTYGR